MEKVRAGQMEISNTELNALQTAACELQGLSSRLLDADRKKAEFRLKIADKAIQKPLAENTKLIGYVIEGRIKELPPNCGNLGADLIPRQVVYGILHQFPHCWEQAFATLYFSRLNGCYMCEIGGIQVGVEYDGYAHS
jgi:hypothetical protein